MKLLSLLINIGLSSRCENFEKRQTSKSYWDKSNTIDLQNSLSKFSHLNMNRAKNILLFIGDGMNINTITATRVHASRNSSNCGEEYRLAMEKLPFSGFSKTYSTNSQTPDSASTATAMLTGYKTEFMKVGTLDKTGFAKSMACGFNPFCNEPKESCINDETVNNLLKYTRGNDFKVGIVSTDTFTGATPSSMYACSLSRWNSGLISDQFFEAVKEQKIDLCLSGGLKYVGNFEHLAEKYQYFENAQKLSSTTWL